MGRLYQRDDRWGIDYTDHRGQRVRQVVAADKSVALRMLADALDAVEKMKAGVLTVDPREAKRPLSVHVEAYLAEMQRRGRDSMYVYIVRKRLEAAAETEGWERLSDCTVRSISTYLQGLARRELSPRTVNQHRADLAAFFGWGVRIGILESNPCDRVAKSACKNDKTRRALSVAECRALLNAAPPERRVIYLFLLFTGLRRAEAAALRWGHVHLDVVNQHVELPASLTKSGRAECVPLVAELADALRVHRGATKDGHPVFESIPPMEIFRADLAAAKIEDVDERGRKVVLHSLRHSLATLLAVYGVPMVIAQRIMRHTDIRLTAQVYTDENLLPLAAAMRALPSMNTATSSLGFVGTDGAKIVPTSGHSAATPGTTPAPGLAASSA